MTGLDDRMTGYILTGCAPDLVHKALCGHGGLVAAGRADLEHVAVHAQVEGEDLLHLC
jgi:hypothetical protein